MNRLPFLVPSSGEEWRRWLTDDGIDIALIVAGVLIAQVIFRRLFSRWVYRGLEQATRARRESPEAAERRARTLLATVTWLFTIFLTLVGISLVLGRLGVNVPTLVAGVGVVGIAIGLGAQALIRDVINGTFIIIEDQYGVGDVVTIAGITGKVEEINPRRTLVRDGDGNVHTVPNGEIRVTTNHTQGFSRINVEVTIDHDEDIERVVAILDEECQRLRESAPGVIAGPKVERVQAFALEGVVVKMTGDVEAGKQWALAGELRRRIKQRFDQEGIHMARTATFAKERGPQP